MEKTIHQSRVELIAITEGQCWHSTEEVAAMAKELLSLRPSTGPSTTPAPKAFDPSKPCQTRDGRKVTIIATNGRGTFPLVGYIEDNTDIKSWTAAGTFLTVGPTKHDLFNVAETVAVTGYVNIYKDSRGDHRFSRIHATKSEADRAYRSTQRFACVPVTIRATAGEGL